MSLRLLSRRAETPFFSEKLNMMLYSGEELCYVILKYPLIAMDDFVTDPLIDWIGSGLHETGLAGSLYHDKKAGESCENLLLSVLQNLDYCRIEEVRDFRSILIGFRKMPEYERILETGKAYFTAGREADAYRSLEKAEKSIASQMRSTKDEEEKKLLGKKRADVLCDMVAVRMLRFDAEGALELLDRAEQTGRFIRAERQRYLITGNADLPDEEKENLLSERRELKIKALSGEKCTEIKELSSLSDEEFLKKAEAIIKEWKKEYRRTS